jgi:hypothetical protein
MLLPLEDTLRELFVASKLHTVFRDGEVEQGMGVLTAEVEFIALSAHGAVVRAIPFAAAVGDWEHFRPLAQIHQLLDDILQLRLPAPLLEWAEFFLATPPANLDALRTALVFAAAHAEEPRLRALARFVLFEGVRANLLIEAKLDLRGTIGKGVNWTDLDDIAEATVDRWLSEAPAAPDGVRPFDVVVAAARLQLATHADGMLEHLLRIRREFEVAQRRATWEERLLELDTPDALLVRNEAAPYLEEQKVGRDLLLDRHRPVFGDVSRSALDQQARRLEQRGRAGKKVGRRGESLLDLIRRGSGGDK